MKTTATLCAPLSRSSLAAARTSSGLTASRMVPSASVRSPTSMRRSRSAIGVKSPHSPQVRRRSRRRISSTSRKPRVVMIPIRAPRRSRMLLVPTVVPCTIEPETKPSARVRASSARPLRKPRASSPRCDGTLQIANVRAARVEQEKVGEGAAHIDAGDEPGVDHRGSLARRRNVASVSSAPSAPTATL